MTWNIVIIWSWKKEISWRMQQLLLLLEHQVWKTAFRIPIYAKRCWISSPVLLGSNTKLCVLRAFLFLEMLHHVVCTDYCSVAETSHWFSKKRWGESSECAHLKTMRKLEGKLLCLFENPSISIKSRLPSNLLLMSVWPLNMWYIHLDFSAL